jgi:hypothetical protein
MYWVFITPLVYENHTTITWFIEATKKSEQGGFTCSITTN